MRAADEHPLVPTLKRQLVERQIERREFLRYATLLGMAAPTAYAFVAKVTGEKLIAPAEAQGALPKGGTLRLAMRCQDLKSPHTYSWVESSNSARQVLDYLTVTGVDNITRPSLVEKWEPSPDLKTWTLRLRKTVKWHNGRQFTADDVVWNLKRVLDPKTGSSVVGLMKGFLLEDVETGEKDDKGNPKKSSRLWDANAIQKVDDFTVRLNGKSAQLAVPEQLFHYPLLILDPAENGEFKVGSNGTGAFTLTANEVGRKQVLKARKEGYWGGGPHLDQLEFIDLGDDPAASVSALASKQVDGLYGTDIVQLEALQKIPHVQMYQVRHGLHGDGAHAAGEALRRQARAPGHALRHRLERGPPDRASRPRPARRASSRQRRPSGVREARAALRGTLPRRRSCSRRRGTRTASTSRSSAGLSPPGSCSPCRPWWSSGRRRASASRSTSCPPRNTGRCGPRCRSASPPGPIARSVS